LKIALTLLAILLQTLPIGLASAHGLRCPPGAKTDWAQRPSGDDLARFYPERESNVAVDGDVSLVCLVDRPGRLRHCAIAEERPQGYGFGKYALRLVPRFRVARPGCPRPGATVTIPIHFRHASD
jgi:TonB family protein